MSVTDLSISHIARKGTKNLADYCHFSLNTAKIISIPTFGGFAESL